MEPGPARWEAAMLPIIVIIITLSEQKKKKRELHTMKVYVNRIIVLLIKNSMFINV